MRKLRIAYVFEYELNPNYYPEGSTLEDMAAIDQVKFSVQPSVDEFFDETQRFSVRVVPVIEED